MKIIRLYTIVLFLASLLISGMANAYVSGTPVPTDSRIKTFVYHANDVFRVLTYYGYQMNIEFADNEEIDTVSLGDPVGWQITPSENRLFIKAMMDKAHTNMTVITDKRTYQFDLHSSIPGEQDWEELVYVVRFYYPEERELDVASFSTPVMAPMQAAFPLQPVIPAMPQMAPMPHASLIQDPSFMMPSMVPPMMSPEFGAPSFAPGMGMGVSPMMPGPFDAGPMLSPSFAPQPGYGVPLGQPGLPPISSYYPSSPSLVPPSYAPPPMASAQEMRYPAAGVPPVQVQRGGYGMVPPPDLAVAPMPKVPHPRSPFVVNHMNKSAQQLASSYPGGSYRDRRLAPRSLPSLKSSASVPRNSSAGSYGAEFKFPMELPLPSSISKGYIDY